MSRKKREERGNYQKVRTTREIYEVFEDIEEEASHSKIFLEEGALKPGHPSKEKSASQPWLPSSRPVNLEGDKCHSSPW